MRNCDSFPKSECKERKACLLRNYPKCKINKKSFDFLAEIYFKLHLLMANGVERSFLQFVF